MVEENKLQRVQINLARDLVTRIDDYSNKMNINRTSAIAVLCNTALMQESTVELMQDFVDLMGQANKDDN